MPNGCVYSCLFPRILGRGNPLPCFSPFYRRTQDRKRVHDVFFEVFTTAIAEIAVFFVRRIATPSLSSRMESQFRTLPLLQNIGKRIPFLSNVQEKISVLQVFCA